MKGHRKINNPVDIWSDKMESKFDVPEDMINELEIEEEKEEVSRKCKICNNIFVVKNEYEFANKDEFICPYCILFLANIEKDK